MFHPNSVLSTTMAKIRKPNGIANKWNEPESVHWSKWALVNSHFARFIDGYSFSICPVQFINHPGLEGRVFGYSNRNHRRLKSTTTAIENAKGEGRVRGGLSYAITCYQSREASTEKTYDTWFVADERQYRMTWHFNILHFFVLQVLWAMKSLASAISVHWVVMRVHRLARVIRSESKRLVRKNAVARNENSIKNILLFLHTIHDLHRPFLLILNEFVQLFFLIITFFH